LTDPLVLLAVDLYSLLPRAGVSLRIIVFGGGERNLSQARHSVGILAILFFALFFAASRLNGKWVRVLLFWTLFTTKRKRAKKSEWCNCQRRFFKA